MPARSNEELYNRFEDRLERSGIIVKQVRDNLDLLRES